MPIDPPIQIRYPQFNENITILIQKNRIYLASYTSVKNGRMWVYWILADKDKKVLIEKELFLKD